MLLEKSTFKIFFVLNGEIEHRLNYETEVRKLKKGDIFLCPGFQRHCFINTDTRNHKKVHVVRFLLDEKLIRSSVARSKSNSVEEGVSQFFYRYLNRAEQLCEGIDSEVARILQVLRKECESREVGYRHVVYSLCVELGTLVARRLRDSLDGPKVSLDAHSKHLVTSGKEYILKNLGRQELTLGEIAWSLGKSEEHFARIFKKETGQSVFDYIRCARVNLAKTYLRDPSLGMVRIADLVGFASQSFFSRTFNKLVGISPSAYRKSLAVEILEYQKRLEVSPESLK